MKQKLKVGILINDDFITSWSYKMLEEIKNSNYADIALIIKNKHKDTSRKSLLYKLYHLLFKNFDQLLYKIYNKLDNFYYKKDPDAFKQKNINNILNDVKTIDVIPKLTKYRDLFSKKDISTIKDEKLDLLIRMGFRILSGDVLTSAKYGIWSYHHGDNSVNRGSPAGFWEVFYNWSETGVTLQILTEDLDNGKILYKSFSQTKSNSVGLNKNNFYWKSLSFIPNKIKELYILGEEDFFKKIDNQNIDPKFYSSPLFRTKNIGNFKMIFFLFWLTKNIIAEKISSLFIFKQWILLFNINNKNTISGTFYRFKQIIPPVDRFWADPFVIQRNNKFYIFIEEFVYKKNRGHISVITMEMDGKYSKPKKVLEKEFHLSYPFVFESDGELFLVPESASINRIDLYKCVLTFL